MKRGPMNLLISASPRSQECAVAIEEATQVRTTVCGDFTKAATLVRSGEYAAVIFDQASLHPDPVIPENILRNAGLAVPVFVNSALMAQGRILAEVRSALARVEREKKLAIRQAEAGLRNEMKGEITGILIAAELALASPSLPVFAEEKLKDIEQLATRMRGRFEMVLAIVALHTTHSRHVASHGKASSSGKGERHALDDFCDSAHSLAAGLELPHCRQLDSRPARDRGSGGAD